LSNECASYEVSGWFV